MLASVLCVSLSTQATEMEFTNLSTYIRDLGFDLWYGRSSSNEKSPVKIAIFDKDFRGYEEQIGKSLPLGTIFHKGPLEPLDPIESETDTASPGHGLVMASIVNQLMTNQLQDKELEASQFHLFNVQGYSNFKAAVEKAIELEIDVILYSEVWELGSNWDGKGFINKLVNLATDSGIIWINAAGNFRGRTYQATVETGTDDWVRLPDKNNALEVKCKPEADEKKCQLRAVLTWNDFNDDVEIGTDKDLDLSLTDDLLNILKTSVLRQAKDSKDSSAGSSLYPREALTYELNPGTYFIKVKNRSKNFLDSDQFRLTVDGDFIEMPSGQSSESLLNPADNPSVITVGANDSERSSLSQSLGKPDIWAPSLLKFEDDGQTYKGSSNAAAIFAAGVSLVKSYYPELDSKQMLTKLSVSRRDGGRTKPPRGIDRRTVSPLTSRELRFGPEQGNCYPLANPSPKLSPPLEALVRDSVAIVVQTTQGWKMMVTFDPVQLVPQRRRFRSDDAILSTPEEGYRLFPRKEVVAGRVPRRSIELFQTPSDFPSCNGYGPISEILGATQFSMPQ